MAKVVIGARKKELGAWHKNGREDRAEMQPQRCEVCVETDEYERERAAAPSVANKAHGRLEKRPYLLVLCGSKTRSHSRTLST